MSKAREEIIVSREPELKEGDERPESGGIVTTVKSELPTNDPDFQAALTRKRIEAGELNQDGSEIEPEKPAASTTKMGGGGGDWQAGLTDEQRREVNRLYRDKKKADRELRDLNDRVTKMEKPAAQPASAPAPTLKRPVRPNALTFSGTPDELAVAEEKYQDDYYEYRKALDAQEQDKRRVEQNQKTVIDKFNSEVDRIKVIPEYEDYEETMDDAENEVSDLMFGAIMEEGPTLGYYLAKHPEESAKIARMPEKQAVKAIMRIVVKIEDAEVKKTPLVPAVKKPEPVPVLRGRGVSPQQPKKMSFKDKQREAYKAGKLNYDPG